MYTDNVFNASDPHMSLSELTHLGEALHASSSIAFPHRHKTGKPWVGSMMISVERHEHTYREKRLCTNRELD